jgi:hypothetical protein
MFHSKLKGVLTECKVLKSVADYKMENNWTTWLRCILKQYPFIYVNAFQSLPILILPFAAFLYSEILVDSFQDGHKIL